MSTQISEMTIKKIREVSNDIIDEFYNVLEKKLSNNFKNPREETVCVVNAAFNFLCNLIINVSSEKDMTTVKNNIIRDIKKWFEFKIIELENEKRSMN